ncbi:MAG: OprO/OprP family phosphate-selective porin [Burkholderiales bacterium]|jgi:phosphate-selective porin OprO/OprP|nr:OprO/OprP family phosphate-selective porin [Burkholderiales bacterium]
MGFEGSGASREARRLRWVVAACAFAALVAGPAHADDDAPPDAAPRTVRRDKLLELLEKLKAKGVISEEEFDEIATETPAERTEARTERRRSALRAAQDQQERDLDRERYKGRWNNGIVFETQDRRTTFNLSGRLDADYRYFLDDLEPSGFDVRRAYFTLQGRWQDWLTWDITGDFAQSPVSPTVGAQGSNQLRNGGSTLDVAWMNAAWSDAVQLRFGQFKMPYSMDQLTSSRFIDFQERSMMDQLVPAKERGAMIHGVPRLGTTYGIALSNGQGKGGNEPAAIADHPDVIARATVNFAELLGYQAIAVAHVGLMGSTGTLANGSTAQGERSEARGYTFFQPSAFNGDNVRRTRSGFELAGAYGPFKLQGEFTSIAYDGRSATGREFAKSLMSYYVSAVWMLTGERFADAYRNGVFGRIVPISNYTPGGNSGWGAWQLGLRFSAFDATDFPMLTAGQATAQGLTGTGVLIVNSATAPQFTNRAEGITVGLHWLWTPNLSVYFNYDETRYANDVVVGIIRASRERAFTTRVHFDF